MCIGAARVAGLANLRAVLEGFETKIFADGADLDGIVALGSASPTSRASPPTRR